MSETRTQSQNVLWQAELTLRNFVSSLTCFGLSRLFNLAERAAPGQVRETLIPEAH